MFVKVSVFCVCYNHENYIRLALEGILNQKTNFDFEVIIYDDLSTDSSREVIDSVIDDYKGNCQFIKIYAEENQYSKGITMSSQVLPKANGKYIAFCEGDDYWTDESKLQRQYDALSSNPDINICFHPVMSLVEDDLLNEGYGDLGEKSMIVPFKEVLRKRGGLMPMASIFIRAKPFLKLISEAPEFFRYNCVHSVIQTVNSIDKGALYLPYKMSVYRKMHPGSWSYKQKLDSSAADREYVLFKRRIFELNRIYNNRYFIDFMRIYAKRSLKFYKRKVKSIFNL